MPKKSNSNGKKIKKSVEVRRTAKRNSPVPNPVVKKPNFNGKTESRNQPKTITADMIAERAYLISISGNGGSQDENWFRAERELRTGVTR